MATEYLFVYGSLRRHADHSQRQQLMRDCVYVADGYVLGRLYELGSYPGAITSSNPQERVYGELYRITELETVLARLDDYEECAAHNPAPHEYLRRALPVLLANGESVNAWVYVFTGDTAPLARITSGDYLAHLAVRDKT